VARNNFLDQRGVGTALKPARHIGAEGASIPWTEVDGEQEQVTGSGTSLRQDRQDLIAARVPDPPQLLAGSLEDEPRSVRGRLRLGKVVEPEALPCRRMQPARLAEHGELDGANDRSRARFASQVTLCADDLAHAGRWGFVCVRRAGDDESKCREEAP
jgi:hypothetical protein